MLDQKEIERLYREEYRPLYEEFAARLHALLELLVKDAGIPVDHIEHRVKTVESFVEKLERKSYADPFQQIKDCVGLLTISRLSKTDLLSPFYRGIGGTWM